MTTRATTRKARTISWRRTPTPRRSTPPHPYLLNAPSGGRPQITAPTAHHSPHPRTHDKTRDEAHGEVLGEPVRAAGWRRGYFGPELNSEPAGANWGPGSGGGMRRGPMSAPGHVEVECLVQNLVEREVPFPKVFNGLSAAADLEPE